MLRATLVALALCALCASADDLNELLLSNRVHSLQTYPSSVRVPANELFGVRVSAPNDNCPTPTKCPQGFTGPYCDIVMCIQKNPRPPFAHNNAIDIRAYASCDATNYFPVDTSIRDSLFIFVDTTVTGSNPTLTLYDPQGNAIKPTKVILNDTQTLEIQYPVSGRGMYAAAFRAGNACVFQAHANTYMQLSVGFTMSMSNDFPTQDLQQFSYSYIVSHTEGLPRPGYTGLMEIWENGVLLSSYDLRARFNCEYHQFAGPVICSQVNRYNFKAYGLDENGYGWMRTDVVRCVQSGPTSPTTPGTPTTPMTTPTKHTLGTTTPTKHTLGTTTPTKHTLGTTTPTKHTLGTTTPTKHTLGTTTPTKHTLGTTTPTKHTLGTTTPTKHTLGTTTPTKHTLGTSTTGAPTTPNPCMNGGYPIEGGGCMCPPQFTGSTCQNIICANGGTGSGSTCTCVTGYTGQYCEYAMCTQTNPIQPVGPNQKSLVLAVQITSTMADDIRALKTYILEVIVAFVEHHPDYLNYFGLVVFNDQYDSVPYAGSDYNAFVNAVHTFFQMSGPGTCKKPVLAALQTALKLSRFDGNIYVFTDSPYSDNSSALIDVFSRIERMSVKVNFIVSPGNQAGCTIPLPALTAYSEIAAFSGAEYIKLGSKRTVIQALQILPTSYMSARMYERQFDDCTNAQEMHLPIDSHTASFIVSVEGYLAGMAVYEPQGTQWMSASDLLNDVNVKVSQVITPCPDGWVQHGSACYQGVVEPASWTDAQAYCLSQRGHLVNVLSGAKQTFLNYELHGADIWTGLNDRVQERTFMWDGPVPIKLDNYWTNWAPGEPSLGQGKDCMAIMHTYVNGTLTDARWYTRRCDEQRMYACQRHAFDSNRHCLPSGYWNLAVITRDGGGPTGKSCKVRVRAQTDLQVFDGFTTSPFNDFPQPQPSGGSGNYIIANIGGRGNNFGHVDGVYFHALNGSQLAYAEMLPRSNCYYQYASTTPGKCPANVFSMTFYGHDENMYTYNRIRDAYCLSSVSEYLTEKGLI